VTPSHQPLVLALDYPGYRTEARMAELRLAEHGVPLHELLRRPLPREADGAHYAARVLAQHPVPGGPDTPVAAVAAYCASAPLAFEVAARIPAGAGSRPPADAGSHPPAVADSRRPPLVILFDAEPGTREPILDSYREALRNVGARPAEPPDLDLLDRDPGAFAECLTAGVRSHALDALREFAADEEEAAASAGQLAETYADWAGHLIAAHHSAVSDWPGDVLHIVSADNTHAPFPHGARSVRQIRVDTPRKDLLRYAGTREAVLDALSGTAGAPGGI
jgi:hypothetical protein